MGKPKVIGVLGGGQLGRMSQEQAALLGIELVFLDAADSPAKQINQNKKHVTGSFTDADKVRELARKCDVLTVEIEHVDTEVLEEIATRGVEVDGHLKKVPVHPSWQTLRLVQDKYSQKEHFKKEGLPVARQMPIDLSNGTEPLNVAGTTYGYPFMLKARKGSYDGRGNFKVRSTDDFAEAVRDMGQLSLYAEEYQPFKQELAVMVMRREFSDGLLEASHPYPAVETIHEDNICSRVFYPPRHVPASVCEKAQQLAAGVVATLTGRGVFAVEMFLLSDGEAVLSFRLSTVARMKLTSSQTSL